MKISNKMKLQLYRNMWRMRSFEEQARVNFLSGKFQGFLHLGVGEEGCVAGITAALRQDDFISATHRGHGVILLKGADSKKMMAELAGRNTGLCHGFGGSMHMADKGHGIMGSNGILGAPLPIMTGVALANMIQKKDSVAVAYFGDGTSNEGAVHEAMNFASVKKLPVIFTCINNLYGMWTTYKDASANTDIAPRAAGYGMEGIIVNGNNVLEVYEKMYTAVEKARSGRGPTFLELKTYRTYDHSIGLREDFRPEEEKRAWAERCPIKTLKEKLLQDGVDEEILDSIENEAVKEMEDAVEFALASPYPDLNGIGDRVYTNMKVEVREV